MILNWYIRKIFHYLMSYLFSIIYVDLWKLKRKRCAFYFINFSMNELKKDTTHAIVQFVTKNSQNEESIDLVPRSWLKFMNNWTCYFLEKKRLV